MSRVVFKGINKSFPGVGSRPAITAVKDLDLEIASGTLVTLLGPSGCGKTTTLRMLAGFEAPSAGTIHIGDQDVTNAAANTRGIGMVFQSYALFPHMSVRQNITYGLRAAARTASDIQRKVDEVLDLMQLQALADRPPEQLSGGQQQRVALARAIVVEPKVLLFDEPLSNLDAQLRERMRDELRALQQRLGITSLYVTHDQTEAMAISDRVVVMRNGVVEHDGSPVAVYTRPRTNFVAEFMGKANLLKATVVSVQLDEIRASIGSMPVSFARNDAGFRVGQVVDCVVRPEHFTLGGPGAVSAEVKRATFQGGHVEYAVEIANQACLVVDHQIHVHGLVDVGGHIMLSLDRAPIWPIGPGRATAGNAGTFP